MIDLSISAIDCGDSSARASNTHRYISAED